MPIKRPDTLPYVVSFEDAPEIEAFEDDDASVDPEAAVFLADHIGVSRALDILTPRQQQVLCQKIGLNESGIPLSRAEIADNLGLSIETISSTLTRARNRLRAVGNIMSVINGEHSPHQDLHDNPLQTS